MVPGGGGADERRGEEWNVLLYEVGAGLGPMLDGLLGSRAH